ncbi:MAG: hypothetical protein K5696_09990 [Lachnospiraceae bacterium]|nr:hypothetical protein [Lachnospiraceae bacterium]
MMEEKKEERVYRKKSVDRLASPEQLDDYLHVTTPAVWAVLAAAILLLAAIIVWSNFAVIESFASGTASVERGIMTVTFADTVTAEHVEAGMTVTIGDVRTTISSVGTSANGQRIATASVNMPDGVYDARVGYRQTQIIRMLFD